MPSPIAHSVTGYCIGRICLALGDYLPKRITQRGAVAIATIAAVIADIDFLPQFFFEGSFHRGISHSIGAAILSSLVLAWLVKKLLNNHFLALLSISFISFLSHLVLDLLTAGGRGMPVFWPLSDALVKSPIALFPRVRHDQGIFFVGHIPVIFYETFFALILLWLTNKFLLHRQRNQLNSRRSLDSYTEDNFVENK